MRKMIGMLCVLSVLALAGCAVETRDRQRSLTDVEGKKVSEALIQNNKTVVIRFTDGTMLEIKDGGDSGLEINGEKD